MLSFVRNFALQFSIGPQNVQFSVITFSSDVSPQFNFNTYTTRNEVIHAIRGTQYLGTGTNTSAALQYAREESFKPANGARANASKIAIVITDGHSIDQASTAREAALLHNIAEVFAIGIGPDVDRDELMKIASGHGTSHIVQVNNFDLLQTIQKQLTDTACQSSVSATPIASTRRPHGHHHNG